MKTIINYLLPFVCCLSFSCASHPTAFDTEMALVFDATDPMTAQYPAAEAITAPLGLHDDPWQGVRIVFTYISDKDVNQTLTVTLPRENEWTGNIAVRKAQINHFITQLQHSLIVMRPVGTYSHSIVFRTLAVQANRLALLQATHKWLLVYSDLRENSDVSFYNSRTLDQLTQCPGNVISTLENTTPLRNLSGVGVWLLYEPVSYKDNNTYMKIAHMYQQVLSSKGAVTHIANTFSL